jgi:hypothetical protein
LTSPTSPRSVGRNTWRITSGNGGGSLI